MGWFAKTVFILWLLWVHLLFYRAILTRYAAILGDSGLGGAVGSLLCAAGNLLSIIGLS